MARCSGFSGTVAASIEAAVLEKERGLVWRKDFRQPIGDPVGQRVGFAGRDVCQADHQRAATEHVDSAAGNGLAFARHRKIDPSLEQKFDQQVILTAAGHEVAGSIQQIGSKVVPRLPRLQVGSGELVDAEAGVDFGSGVVRLYLGTGATQTFLRDLGYRLEVFQSGWFWELNEQETAIFGPIGIELVNCVPSAAGTREEIQNDVLIAGGNFDEISQNFSVFREREHL